MTLRKLEKDFTYGLDNYYSKEEKAIQYEDFLRNMENVNKIAKKYSTENYSSSQ